MSKKKQYVIDAERQSFVYGDEERGIKGCVANGIDEKAANSIYDSMVDFAKYAFNKSHAAAYAKISVQTAWLKNYYPVEFMAALMTSVIDNSAKRRSIFTVVVIWVLRCFRRISTVDRASLPQRVTMSDMACTP